MPLLQKPSLAQLTYVVQFKEPHEKVRFTQGDAEVAFGSFGAGQSQQTNLPDAADPSQPRIIFVKERRSIAISQLAVQFSEGFEGGDLMAQFEATKTRIASFHQQALEYRQAKEYGSLGVVLQINYPSQASTEELHQFVYDKFIALPQIGELASVQLTLGFKIDDRFVNLGASVYETRHFEFNNQKPVMPATILVDVAKAKVIAKGVQLSLDINDRPLRSKNSSVDISSPDELLNAASSFLTDKLPKIINVELP